MSDPIKKFIDNLQDEEFEFISKLLGIVTYEPFTKSCDPHVLARSVFRMPFLFWEANFENQKRRKDKFIRIATEVQSKMIEEAIRQYPGILIRIAENEKFLYALEEFISLIISGAPEYSKHIPERENFRPIVKDDLNGRDQIFTRVMLNIHARVYKKHSVTAGSETKGTVLRFYAHINTLTGPRDGDKVVGKQIAEIPLY